MSGLLEPEDCEVCGEKDAAEYCCDQCDRCYCDDCGPSRDDDVPADYCETCWHLNARVANDDNG